MTNESFSMRLLTNHGQVGAGPGGVPQQSPSGRGPGGWLGTNAFMPDLLLRRGKPLPCWMETGCEAATNISATALLQELLSEREGRAQSLSLWRELACCFDPHCVPRPES